MTARKRPRVALVAHEVQDQQGSERVIKELIRRAHGEVDFVVISRKLAEDLRPLVEWRRAPAPEKPYRLKFTTFFLTAAIQLLRARADLVHVHAIGPTIPNRSDLTSVHLFRAGLYESFGIFAPNGVSRSRRVSPSLHLALERWCYRRARMLAAFSPGHKRELERHFPDVPVTVTPNAVDTKRFHPDAAVRRELRAAEGVGSDQVVVLFVANAWRQRGLPAVIEGLAQAAPTAPVSLRLWVVGYGDAERYGSVAREWGVADRVRFFGLQRDVERFYQAADLFVFPTAYETFCLSVYEAAACGLAVVATRVSGVEDLLGGGEAGLVVEPTAEAVGKAIARLAADPALRERMGEIGRQRASAYTWERSVASVLDAYRRLLSA